MNGSHEVPFMWLPRSFSRPLWLEADLQELTGHSASELKPPEDSLSRPYWDPKVLLLKPCKSRSSIPMGGRLREFTNGWMDIPQDPFALNTIQGHLLLFNQKSPLMTPTNKHKAKFQDQGKHDDLRGQITVI